MRIPVIVLGGGGHARVLVDALKIQLVPILGYTSPETDSHVRETKEIGKMGIHYLGDDQIVFDHLTETVRLVNGLGSTGVPDQRKRLFEFFKQHGYQFADVIHPSAVIANDVLLSEGVQLMAGSIVQAGSKIGDNAIVNTRASVDHDCIIGNHVHIAPGATLCGEVTVGDCSHIGSGATVIQGVKIGKNCLIGAGSLVLKDVPDGSKVMGVPAREV